MTLFPSNNKITASKRGLAAASFGAVAAIALAFSAPAIAGPGGHGDQHLTFAVGDRLFNGGIGFDLVEAQAGMIVG